MTEQRDEADLLQPGQTLEQWWQQNGQNHEAMRAARKVAYEQQRDTTPAGIIRPVPEKH
jgi:hypothetical protein